MVFIFASQNLLSSSSFEEDEEEEEVQAGKRIIIMNSKWHGVVHVTALQEWS